MATIDESGTALPNTLPAENAPARKTYDSACEILAEYFLGQPRSLDDVVQELAQHIQDAVEDWFSSKEIEAAIAKAEAV